MVEMWNSIDFFSAIVCVTDQNIYFIFAFSNTNLLLQDTNSFCIASHKALHAEFQLQWTGASLTYETVFK
jgi:hypothetical protein